MGWDSHSATDTRRNSHQFHDIRTLHEDDTKTVAKPHYVPEPKTVRHVSFIKKDKAFVHYSNGTRELVRDDEKRCNELRALFSWPQSTVDRSNQPNYFGSPPPRAPRFGYDQESRLL
jgi:hypothetical protein